MNQDTAIEIDLLPELDTRIGMIGTMTQVEVGGNVCLETGLLVISHGGLSHSGRGWHQ